MKPTTQNPMEGVVLELLDMANEAMLATTEANEEAVDAILGSEFELASVKTGMCIERVATLTDAISTALSYCDSSFMDSPEYKEKVNKIIENHNNFIIFLREHSVFPPLLLPKLETLL